MAKNGNGIGKKIADAFIIGIGTAGAFTVMSVFVGAVTAVGYYGYSKVRAAIEDTKQDQITAGATASPGTGATTQTDEAQGFTI